MTSDPDQWFWNILARAGKLERDRILSSDEALAEYIKANPLSPEERKECDAAVERLRARLLKTAKDFMDRDSQGQTGAKE
jgi:hypothetical protein